MRYTVEVTTNAVCWFKEGTNILHREDGPAIEYANGIKNWYKEGKLHRLDGPASEQPNGSKTWYIEGKFHREDGPAIEYDDGSKMWYLEDVNYSEKQYNEKMKPSLTCEGKVVEIDGKKYKLSLV